MMEPIEEKDILTTLVIDLKPDGDGFKFNVNLILPSSDYISIDEIRALKKGCEEGAEMLKTVLGELGYRE